MCGIFGFVNGEGSKLNSLTTLFEELMIVDVLRGSDGAGVAVVPSKTVDDNVYTYKRGMWGPEFLQQNGYQNCIRPVLGSARVAIGHNRAATKASTSDKNAHPFISRHITLVHNGYIQNSYAITPKGFGPEVDSEAAAWALAEHGEKDGLEKLRGAFALAWYNKDDKTFNVARNEGRELHCIYVKDMNILFYASEWMMLHLCLKRNGVNLDGKYRLLTPFQHLKFNIENPREYTKTPFVEPQSSQSTTGWGTPPYNTESIGTASGSPRHTPGISRTTSGTGSTSALTTERRSVPPTIDKDDLEVLLRRFQLLHKQNPKGGAIPTKRGKIQTTFERLAKVGYRLGQTILIDIGEFEPYKNQRNHGLIKGTRKYVDPKKADAVIMQNMSVEQFFKLKSARTVYGTLVNLRVDKATKKITLVALLDAWADADSKIVPRNAKVLTLPGGKGGAAEAVVNTETGEVIKMVQGKDGVMIPVAEFNEKTKHGCGECSGFVNPDRAPDVLWFGDSPLCHECASEAEIVLKLFPDKVVMNLETRQYMLKKAVH